MPLVNYNNSNRGYPARVIRYTKDGYLELRAPWHPLAMRNGYVSVARARLYAKIGPGVHPCAHCGTSVEWGSTLEADHLNWFTLDNRPANLVQSCGPCNRKRRRLCTLP